jgi:predicted Fe-S protein YdhL (DUF1289 family)
MSAIIAENGANGLLANRKNGSDLLVIAKDKSTVASPCVNVCQMDSLSGLCRGCFRTLDEICAWSRAVDDVKLDILAAVDRRRAEHDPCGAEFCGDCDR